MRSDASTDRFLIAMGAFLGFAGAFLMALRTAGDDISGALLRGSIAMLIGALLMKIFIHIAHGASREARTEKMREVAKMKAQAEAAQHEAEASQQKNEKQKAG